MESKEEVRTLFRECALAILNTGNDQDDVKRLLKEYADFEIEVVPEARGPKLAVRNAPGTAFVDGNMFGSARIPGWGWAAPNDIREHAGPSREIRDDPYVSLSADRLPTL